MSQNIPPAIDLLSNR